MAQTSKTELPLLPYNLREHKPAIIIQWTVIVFMNCILNLILVYTLWFRTTLSHTLVFAIPNILFGVTTFFSVAQRLRKLWATTPQYRSLNTTSRWSIDVFQVGYFLGIIITTAEIVIALSIRREPLIRLLAMPAPTLMFQLAIMSTVTLVLGALSAKNPIPIGSLTTGERTRPALYHIIEDIVAVDGGGGIPFRQALDARYRASPLFRAMLWKLSLAWTTSFYVVAAACTTVVWTVRWEIGYAVAWSVPFVAAGIMALATVAYVKRCMAEERQTWASAL